MKNTIKKYRIDIIVIASLLLFACLALLVFSLTRKHGAFAVVEIDGNTVHSFPLSVDGVLLKKQQRHGTQQRYGGNLHHIHGLFLGFYFLIHQKRGGSYQTALRSPQRAKEEPPRSLRS